MFRSISQQRNQQLPEGVGISGPEGLEAAPEEFHKPGMGVKPPQGSPNLPLWAGDQASDGFMGSTHDHGMH